VLPLNSKVDKFSFFLLFACRKHFFLYLQMVSIWETPSRIETAQKLRKTSNV